MDYAPQDDSRVIYHEGVAEEVEGCSARVRFVQNGACGACTLKSVCNPAEQRVRLVTATHDGTLRAGEPVEVGVAESAAWLSILFSFFLPFLTVAGSFFAVYLRTGNDITAGLVSLATLPLYYGIVYLNRNRLRSRVRFTARPAAGTNIPTMRGLS